MAISLMGPFQQKSTWSVATPDDQDISGIALCCLILCQALAVSAAEVVGVKSTDVCVTIKFPSHISRILP